jgi:acyl-lipid omega-6 desaturase (Delta-12 desaturase)
MSRRVRQNLSGDRPLQKFIGSMDTAMSPNKAEVPLDRAKGQQAPTQVNSMHDELKLAARRWAMHCAQFRGSIPSRAITQIITTTAPFLAVVTLMFLCVVQAYWATLLLAIPAGGLLVRFFIIQHDCGHGSFLPGEKINRLVGLAMSVLTVTPYGLWRREHAIHHAGSGHLERRGAGDIDTKTVAEYKALPLMERVWYRLYRHPVFLFFFGVPFYFMIMQRLPWFHALPARETWRSVMGLNVALVAVYGSLGYVVGLGNLLSVAIPIVFVASAIGGWLFFIQHQFEDTRWDDGDSWDFQIAAIHGSSYYVLPKVLQWFTGNIGLHHIHHLNSMVPNYRLQECLDALPELSMVNRLTLVESFKCVRLALWDEAQRKMVGFRDIARA